MAVKHIRLMGWDDLDTGGFISNRNFYGKRYRRHNAPHTQPRLHRSQDYRRERELKSEAQVTE